MLAELRPWVECESPTFDPAAIARMMGAAGADLAHRRHRGAHPGFGDAQRLSARALSPFRARESGICDMKGGTYAAFAAVAALPLSV